ncbi:hypothetical protein INT45_011273 [Circinella minor]|uniref:Uncharacterized protein n=1 Tax=Circinella minor TaxID=1195481 RepID=A0A8H7RW19_9FUNG|nr:hypothetical protein INT45_011273 [Circinella minor]
MSKEMLKDEQVIDLIVKRVVGSDSQSIYTTKAPEWFDGKKFDVVYTPVVKATEALPPVLIEVQNTVDKAFIRRVIKYCRHLCEEYDVEPIVVIFSIHPIPPQISNTLDNTDKASYMKILQSEHWAQAAYFLDPKTIAESLLETPLSPLVAIEYVFNNQKQPLYKLEKKDDPIVKLLYAISKKALDNKISTVEKTMDILLDVCNNTEQQFKRIIDAVEQDGPDTKRIKLYALDGARYASSCTSKYSLQGSCSSTMPEPMSLPPNVRPLANYQPQLVLEEIPGTGRKTDMEWTKTFVDEYKKEKRKMNWKDCYELGLEEGYFKSYKNYQSLKTTYHNWVNNQKE